MKVSYNINFISKIRIIIFITTLFMLSNVMYLYLLDDENTIIVEDKPIILNKDQSVILSAEKPDTFVINKLNNTETTNNTTYKDTKVVDTLWEVILSSTTKIDSFKLTSLNFIDGIELKNGKLYIYSFDQVKKYEGYIELTDIKLKDKSGIWYIGYVYNNYRHMKYDTSIIFGVDTEGRTHFYVDYLGIDLIER